MIKEIADDMIMQSEKSVKLADDIKGRIVNEVEELSSISEENAASNQEVTASIESMAGSISTISEKADLMGEMADKLIGAIEVFK